MTQLDKKPLIRQKRTGTIKITKVLSLGIGIGKDTEGNTIPVINGDLFLNSNCDVVFNGNTAVPKQFDYVIEDLIKDFCDKDHLISTNELKEIPKSKVDDRIFELNSKWCVPEYASKKLVEIAFENKLWNQAKIKIDTIRHRTIARATYFGVNFVEAINEAIKTGESITHLFCPHQKDWSEQGLFADFLIKITKTKKGNIEFNGWQAIGNEACVYYVHGIFDISNSFFEHIDFAYHEHYSISTVKQLITTHKGKPKLKSKNKIFRLDGEIEVSIGFQLMKYFFPIDKLMDEFYECTNNILI